MLRPKRAIGLVWLGIRSVLGIGTNARDFDAFQATDFLIEAQGKRIEVARDGEVDTMDTPVRYRIRQKALRVMAPRADSTAGKVA